MLAVIVRIALCSCTEEVDTSLEDKEIAEDHVQKRREENVVETDDEDAESSLSGDDSKVPEYENEDADV